MKQQPYPLWKYGPSQALNEHIFHMEGKNHLEYIIAPPARIKGDLPIKQLLS